MVGLVVTEGCDSVDDSACSQGFVCSGIGAAAPADMICFDGVCELKSLIIRPNGE